MRTVDMGTKQRDKNGQFAEVFTLSYEHFSKGEWKRIVRHLPKDGISTIARVLASTLKREWDLPDECETLREVSVTNRHGDDVTFNWQEFCFEV